MVNLQTSRLKSDLRVTQQERDALKQEVISLHQKLQNANDKVCCFAMKTLYLFSVSDMATIISNLLKFYTSFEDFREKSTVNISVLQLSIYCTVCLCLSINVFLLVNFFISSPAFWDAITLANLLQLALACLLCCV